MIMTNMYELLVNVLSREVPRLRKTRFPRLFGATGSQRLPQEHEQRRSEDED